ncbi:hypothetical protein V7S82_24165, partial [Enterobacter hormaechei subsp. steigerwaltii]|uniref:hypothetical protein n=1 Tax=Enterobacter hormaechei TaxID=158836 RepID=UPI003204C303
MNHGLSPEKQKSPGQVADVSLQEALGTVKPATVACGSTFHLGCILNRLEFQEAAVHYGRPALGTNYGLSTEKQKSPGQVPDVSLQEALGTVKPA